MKIRSLFPWLSRLFAAFATALLLCSFPVSATVNVVAYWRMGEDDPGASAGTSVTNSMNDISTTNLIFSGSAGYYPFVSPLAAARVNSSLSIFFPISAYGRTNIVSSATDNFGIEAWVYPELQTTNGQVIAYNGDTGTSGWGIIIDANTNFVGLFGGRVAIEGPPATLDVWTDVALVRTGGSAILYVNGAPMATNTLSPNVPTGSFAVGAPPQNPTNQFFAGYLDEVRVFSFANGQFQTNDLIVNAGLPMVRAGTATPLTTTSSTLNGYVFPNGVPTTTWFQWGTDTSYGHTNTPTVVSSPPNNLSPLPISIAITGLSAGTTYHYALSASNALGIATSLDSTFTVMGFATTAIGLPNVVLGAAAWADYDNDGRLDFLLSGETNNGPGFHGITQLWHNNGDGTFSNLDYLNLPPMQSGFVAWGDYDNDGWPDFLISGVYTNKQNLTQLWHNNHSGIFSPAAITNLPNTSQSSIAWGDFDNDGRLDILFAGTGPGGNTAQVWRNNGDGSFSNAVRNLGQSQQAAWGDYNNDGRLDAFLDGKVLQNASNGTFRTVVTLPTLPVDSMVLGDYDNDGYLDILAVGSTNGVPVVQVWHNNGDGTFSNINVNLPGVSHAAVAWGDFDNDGRLDILLTGTTNDLTSGAITGIWHNNGNGTFSNVVSGLPAVSDATIALGDYDNDGRIDILILGKDPSGKPLTQLWRNETLQTNTTPQTPSGLFAEVSGTNIVFHWNASSDSQTPPDGLTYNLRVGSTSGASDVITPMAATSGFLRVPQPGNNQTLLTKIFPSAVQNFYWSVQAVDTSLASSPFAPEQSFTLLPVMEPVGTPNSVPGDTNGDGTVDENELAAVLAHITTNGTVSPANLGLALRNYFAAYPLIMSNVDGLGSARILFTLPNSPDPNLSVQSSTDLIDWQSLGPVNYGFIDTNGVTNQHRYYRLTYP